MTGRGFVLLMKGGTNFELLARIVDGAAQVGSTSGRSFLREAEAQQFLHDQLGASWIREHPVRLDQLRPPATTR